MSKHPLAIQAFEAPPRTRHSILPEPFASRMKGRVKHPLGDLFGLKNFGVNLTRVVPGGISSLMHRHTRQDEFVYVLEGELVLVTDEGEVPMKAGMCAGFAAGARAHHLVNRSDRDAVYLEVGDRTPGDEVSYPADDLRGTLGEDGQWRFTRKDGSSWT
jgi:uncharacterized cupin superfamily protein